MAEQQSDAGEKEFEATPQRREQARRDGDVAYSKEVSGFAVVLGGVIAVSVFQWFAATRFFDVAVSFLQYADMFADDAFNKKPAITNNRLIYIVSLIAIILIIPMLILMAVLISARSLVFSVKRIAPKIEKISPIKNIKNKYGAKGITDFLKDAIKFLFACFICASVLFYSALQYYGIAQSYVDMLIPETVRSISTLLLIFLVFYFILAILDLPLQNYLLSRRLRMSREELKKDMKQSEGDPQLKQSRRDRAANLTRGQALHSVKDATVVLVNPTHYSVALRWDPESGCAPICVAKGADNLAARIREIAGAHGVPIFSDPPTARSIYQLVEIDAEIQPKHFAAVAAAIQFAQKLDTSSNGS